MIVMLMRLSDFAKYCDRVVRPVLVVFMAWSIGWVLAGAILRRRQPSPPRPKPFIRVESTDYYIAGMTFNKFDEQGRPIGARYHLTPDPTQAADLG